MATWKPVTGLNYQYQKDNGDLASGYYLQFEAAGTSTSINMATDSTGGTELARVLLNSAGKPESSGAEFVPHIDQLYKYTIYPTLTDAQNKTNAVGNPIDNLRPIGDFLSTTNIFYAENYDTFSDAVTAASGKELVISTNLVVASNITVNDVVLRFAFGGDLDPNTGVTITLDTPVLAGNYRIFNGLGTIAGNFGNYPVNALWNTEADGATDDRDGIDDLVSAIGTTGTLFFPIGTYKVESAATWECHMEFLNGGMLSIDAGITVTLNGSIEAGDWEIFDRTTVTSVLAGTFLNNRTNVMWWGANHDLNVNQSTVINSALTSINTANGGELFFPAGEYRCDGVINLYQYNYINLVGVGGTGSYGATSDTAQSRLSVNTALDYLIDARGSFGCGFVSLNLQSGITGSATDGFSGDLLHLGSHSSIGDSRNAFVDLCTIGGGNSSNDFTNSNSGINLSRATNISITRCMFRNITKHGIVGKEAGPADFSNGVLIERCNFEEVGADNVGAGLEYATIAQPGQGWSILNNTFQGNRSGRLYVLSALNICQCLVFEGNVMYNDSPNSVMTDAGYCMRLAVQGASISGNCIVGNGGCIWLTEDGNGNNCKGVTIENNVLIIESSGLPAASRIGIYFGTGASSPHEDITIANNFFEGVNFTAYVDRGPNGQYDAGVIQISDPDSGDPYIDVACDTTSITGGIHAFNQLRTDGSVEQWQAWQRLGTDIMTLDGNTTTATFHAGNATMAFNKGNDTIAVNVPLQIPVYTVVTLPAASTYANGLITVSDETGGHTMAFSDGLNWRRVQDRAVVS